MNLKKIKLISKTAFLLLTLCFVPIAFASEVTGTLNSDGTTGGAVISGGGIINGRGGSGIVSNTTPSVNNLSSYDNNIAFSNQGALIAYASYESETPIIPATSLNKINVGIVAKDILGGIAIANAQGDSGVQNTNQLASAVASGFDFGLWSLWVLLILLLIIIGYYIYKRYERNKEKRKGIK